jgi:hypothetical protein
MRHTYADWMAWNTEPVKAFLSGWYFRAILRYAFFKSESEAVGATPDRQCKHIPNAIHVHQRSSAPGTSDLTAAGPSLPEG